MGVLAKGWGVAEVVGKLWNSVRHVEEGGKLNGEVFLPISILVGDGRFLLLQDWYLSVNCSIAGSNVLSGFVWVCSFGTDRNR